MTKAEKSAAIEALKEQFGESSFFYLADASTLTVEEVTNFRRLCFEKGVRMKVVKNTLARMALKTFNAEKGFEGLFEALRGPTAVLFTDTANLPAKLLKEFRETHERPLLKAAYIDTDIYFGDDQIQSLTELKSKEDLVAEVIALLQSPMMNVLGSLQSGANTLSGLLKALEERAE